MERMEKFKKVMLSCWRQKWDHDRMQQLITEKNGRQEVSPSLHMIISFMSLILPKEDYDTFVLHISNAFGRIGYETDQMKKFSFGYASEDDKHS
eukprot:TRINITY_DN12698_c0_g1_i1.p1 TRINITY_DN12698_c0_g1~~TRINITY_DN12698_c0_g1_i1.p1  ORF type:complete len:94 (+),score=18.85 TRINITY_DN12698_c0_g1_i1:223-504(+)